MIHLVRIKHQFCWFYDHDGEPKLIQPVEYLRAFDHKSSANDYKAALDNREILPSRGISPFSGFFIENEQLLRSVSSERMCSDQKGTQSRIDCLSALMSRSEKEFFRDIKKLGILPPNQVNVFFGYNKTPYKVRAWYSWWSEVEPGVSDTIRFEIWKMLDNLDMFQVDSVEFEDE